MERVCDKARRPAKARFQQPTLWCNTRRTALYVLVLRYQACGTTPAFSQALWISLGRDESELNDPFDINSPENPSFMAW